jgi:hypothetical protein
MPCLMAYDVTIAETYCPYGHPAGCPKHIRPIVAGKTFAMQDYREQLNQLGFTGAKAELVADTKAKKKPPGQAKTVNGATIYPARRFA